MTCKQYLSLIILSYFSIINLNAQRGYYDAPYKRYEADQATLANAVVLSKSYKQADLQSEASGQVCVTMSAANASAEWTVTEAADGLVVRYSVPDSQSGTMGVYNNGTKVATLNLTSNWSWEYLSTNGNPNNVGVVNTNPKMRFDEVRVKLAAKIPTGGKLKLIRESGNISLDFAELEAVTTAKTAPTGAVTYSGDGSTLQTFIDGNGGKTIFLPAGVYNVNRKLWFGVNNTKLIGAGMWYTQINFTYTTANEGGLYADAAGICFSDLYLTTVRNSRTNSYKAINGVYTATSVIENVWAEHFVCGAWIAQYWFSGVANADGFVMKHCRFRNNYADGVNLCKGTANAIVEHCSFRNNGDDDMAVWSADGLECQNNTFRYNTSENCWRAAGCAIYGGLSNKAHNLLIRDNLEVGLRVNNSFPGIAFNTGGLHQFTDITIENCGTMNDLFNTSVGAIDLVCNNVAGTRINNVKFANIDIVNSKNDAVYIRKQAGEGFYNLIFENINIDGTGKEYPDNNVTNSTAKRGYGLLFAGSPAGNATYCGMSYTNRGGDALTDTNTAAKGSLAWTALVGCLTTNELEQDENKTSVSAQNNKLKINSLNINDIVKIYNTTGQLVQQIKSSSTNVVSDILATGIYIVSVNKAKTVKIILNK